MKIISVAELEERGWKVVSRKVPRDYEPFFEWRHDLFSPDGSLVGTYMLKDEAWSKCPDVPEDGLMHHYSWTMDEEVDIVDPHDEKAIEAIQDEYGEWGTHRIVLLKSDIDALLSGKCIVWGQHEYTSIIYFQDED